MQRLGGVPRFSSLSKGYRRHPKSKERPSRIFPSTAQLTVQQMPSRLAATSRKNVQLHSTTGHSTSRPCLEGKDPLHQPERHFKRPRLALQREPGPAPDPSLLRHFGGFRV